jgi:hypothetical protein
MIVVIMVLWRVSDQAGLTHAIEGLPAQFDLGSRESALDRGKSAHDRVDRGRSGAMAERQRF